MYFRICSTVLGMTGMNRYIELQIRTIGMANSAICQTSVEVINPRCQNDVSNMSCQRSIFSLLFCKMPGILVLPVAQVRNESVITCCDDQFCCAACSAYPWCRLLPIPIRNDTTNHGNLPAIMQWLRMHPSAELTEPHREFG